MRIFRTHPLLPAVIAASLAILFCSAFVVPTSVATQETKTITLKSSEGQHIVIVDRLGDRTSQVQYNKPVLAVFQPCLAERSELRKGRVPVSEPGVYRMLHRPAYRGNAP